MRTLTPILVLLALWTCAGTGAFATPPSPTYASASVDGSPSEWSESTDFFTDMYNSGNPDNPLWAKAGLRYDCSTQTLYVLMLLEPGIVGYHDPNSLVFTSWVAINSISNKLVNEHSGNDGVPPDFQWIDGGPGQVSGFEASFTLAPGTYHIFIQQMILEGVTYRFASTPGYPSTGPLLVIDCSPTGACCDPETGNCILAIASDCPAGDEWHTEWTACDPNPCPLPVPAERATWGRLKDGYR